MKFAVFSLLLSEIILFIVMSNLIGFSNVIFLTFGTCIVGLLILRKVWKDRIQLLNDQTHMKTQLKINEFTNDLFLVLASMFLIIPGFFTDLFAFLLLNKRCRNILIRTVLDKLVLNFQK